MRSYTLILFFVVACLSASAQRKCGTDVALQQLLGKHPSLARKVESVETQLRKARPDNRLFRVNPRVTIPVVVHIVLQNPTQVTDQQIMNQLASVNLDYIAQNSDINKVPAAWQAIIGNPEIQFCLAVRSPDGDPTTGITRTTTTRSSFSIEGAARDVKHSSTGGADAWDPTKYLNIWVCSLTDNYLGVATPPGNVYPADEDGVVVLHTAFGSTGSARTPFNLGRTLTHEIGHYFGLRHIWGDDGGTCNQDDGVDDTPRQGDQNYGCPNFPLTDACTAAAPGVMFMNYMDYVNDACMFLFTTGQTDRMRNALDAQRLSLLSSNGCQAVNLKARDAGISSIQQPEGYRCGANQSPVVTLKNRGTSALTQVTIRYTVNNGAPVSFSWTGNLASLAETGVNLPGLQAAEGVSVLKAYTHLPNGAADEQPENDTSTVEFSYYAAKNLPFRETFEAGVFPPVAFSLRNPDRSFTWEKATTGSKGSGTSAMMRNLGYAVNDQVDDLIGPVVNASGADSVWLRFDVAAATTTSTTTPTNPWDTLEVLITKDCGATFIPTGYKKWGAKLITRQTPTGQEFVPTAAEWRTDSVDLTPFVAGNQEFRVVFRNTSNYENNVYIDDINIVKKDINRILNEKGILIWPNAFTRQFFIEFKTWPEDLKGISVYDAAGRLYYTVQPVVRNGNRTTIDLVNALNGVYFVKLFYSQQVRTYKIVKAK
ncbi:T9SS C-terminal target domain-containing protein [Chitinophaga lutea]|uniref:T9SS C-terminal target domain-containing protein n=1 Tax=Chitinophaga lutea TaxID=2488634 RepID=A0A3N4PU74_9BACT|nr:M43 family zinc metalloprotease [Chitinophaga lutea]RPE08581.1 T9SS C-terminal target domain-containing protein [Chitinophaga lutea]